MLSLLATKESPLEPRMKSEQCCDQAAKTTRIHPAPLRFNHKKKLLRMLRFGSSAKARIYCNYFPMEKSLIHRVSWKVLIPLALAFLAEEDLKREACWSEKEFLDYCSVNTADGEGSLWFPACSSCLKREYNSTILLGGVPSCADRDAKICPLIAGSESCKSQCSECSGAAEDYASCLYEEDRACSSLLNCNLQDPCESERLNARVCVGFAECSPLCTSHSGIGPCPPGTGEGLPPGSHADCAVLTWTCPCPACSGELSAYRTCVSQIESTTVSPTIPIDPRPDDSIPVSSDSEDSSTGLAAGVAIGAVVAVSAAIAAVYMVKKNARRVPAPQQPTPANVIIDEQFPPPQQPAKSEPTTFAQDPPARQEQA